MGGFAASVLTLIEIVINGSVVLLIGQLIDNISPYTKVVSFAIIAAMAGAFILLYFQRRQALDFSEQS